MAMTDGSDGTGWVGFGYGELVCILMQFDDVTRAVGKELFDLADSVLTEDVAAAGLSSLAARELVRPSEDGAAVTDGAAALLTFAFAELESTVRIGLLSSSDEIADAAVLLRAPGTTLLLQPRNFASWVMVAKTPEISDAEAVFAFVEGFLTAHEGSAAFIEIGPDAGGATAFVRAAGTEQWELITGATAHEEEVRRPDLDAGQVRRHLATVLGED